MFDLITIGDTVIDTIIPLENAELKMDENIAKICLPLGLKIGVGDSTTMVGGNAANNAVGASRLGLKTAIYTNVGKKDEDEADKRIETKFKNENVDIRYLVHNHDYPTSHNIVLSFKNERTILVHHHAWNYQLPDLDNTKWVYLTSLVSNFEQTQIIDQIIYFIERTNAKLFYQPGTFQIQQGYKKNSKILSMSNVLVLNLEEASILLGQKNSKKKDFKKSLKSLLSLGPRNVILTNGSDGSYATNGDEYFKMDVMPAKVIQKVGAGDAFATGVLAGLFYSQNLDESLRWGTANAAAVIEKIGPQTGLLNYQEMQEKLDQNKNIAASKI